jgi:amino acid permease
VKTVKFLAPRGGAEDATYAGLAFHVYGKQGEKFVELGLVLQQFGACVGYIVVIGDIFYPLLGIYLPQLDGVTENMVRNLVRSRLLLFLPMTISMTIFYFDICF